MSKNCNTILFLLFLPSIYTCADGRCHRHGQTHPVHVKCYYIPVSIESRLLDRRKIAAGNSSSSNPITRATRNNDPQIIFSSLNDDDDDDESCDDIIESMMNDPLNS
jgi:hypothetical protein